MTMTSSFPMAFGMMMVENVPFMHIICNICIDAQGMGKDTFATVFVAFAISTISVGIFFYLLGHYRMGNIVYFFPKHVIVGCIGGIGVFLFITGMEGSTNTSWKWELESMKQFFSTALLPLWLTSLGFEFLLRYLSSRIKDPLLVPCFFVSIPFVFYIFLFISGIPITLAHERGWFFQFVAGNDDPLQIWDLIDFQNVNWISILKCVPTIIALTVFSLMHVPINIPSLSVSTGYPVDMNKELKAHGISNILSGCTGGLQNYVCYCNSVTYYKCKGGGILSGLLLASISSIFYFIGPSAVAYVPRCMAGCLLMHIGSDLIKEALWDSIGVFDKYECGSVLAITIVMTAYGMTAGLALGVFCAALTYTLQSSQFVPPIRAVRTAKTVRSSMWRSKQMSAILQEHSRSISIVQLQGHIFFGNATLISMLIENMLNNTSQYNGIRFIILDFNFVLAVDSSGAETVTKLIDICKKFHVRLCYSKASPKGFPGQSKLMEKIINLTAKDRNQNLNNSNDVSQKNKNNLQNDKMKKIGKSNSLMSGYDTSEEYSSDINEECSFQNTSYSNALESSITDHIHMGESKKNTNNDHIKIQIQNEMNNNNNNDNNNNNNNDDKEENTENVANSLFVANSLDESLIWCENILIEEYLQLFNDEKNHSNIHSDSLSQCGRLLPVYLHQVHALCPYESSEIITALFARFDKEKVAGGTVLWKQGDRSTRAVLLSKGRLSSTLEEENEQSIIEDISVGHLVGNFIFTSNLKFLLLFLAVNLILSIYPVFLCFLMISYDFLCFLMFSYVFLCFLMFSYVFLCFLMFSYVFL